MPEAAHEIGAQIGDEAAQGAQQPGHRRHDDPAEVEFARQHEGVGGPCRAIAEQRELLGIDATARQLRHGLRIDVRGGDLQHRVRSLFDRQAQSCANRGQCRACLVELQLHLSAQDRGHDAENGIGIGYGRLGAAAAIAGGTWIGAG